MLEIIAIDHLVLRTTKVDDMLNFYGNVLGCSVERTLPELGLIQLRAGSGLIDIVPVNSELGRLGGKAPQQNGRNLEHFCLTVGDMDETQLVNYLKQHAIQHEPPAERYGAAGFSKSVYINDPEGNVVELKLADLKIKDLRDKPNPVQCSLNQRDRWPV